MTRFVLFSERYIHISYIWCLSHVSKTSSGRGALRFLMLFFLIHIYLLFNNPQFISQKNCWQVSMYSHLQYKLDDTLFFLFIFVPVQPYSLFIRFNPCPNRIKSIYYFSGFVKLCTGLWYWQSWSSALGSGCIVHYHRPSVSHTADTSTQPFVQSKLSEKN